MKYKVGDKVNFVKDYTLETGKVISANSVWEVKSVLDAHYRLERVVGNQLVVLMIERKIAEDYCGKINTELSITKQRDEKHDILNGLTNTDALKPDYYQYRGGDVFDMAAHFQLNFPLGNALKYLLRAGHKDPAKKVEDLQKAIQCIERAIELEG